MQYSIVNKKCLDKIVFRLDAEYYHPALIALEKHIATESNVILRNAKAKLDCSAFYPSIVPFYNFEKHGTPFLRVNEIQNGLVNVTDETVFLPDKILNENYATIAKCYPNDIIIAKGGNSLAKVALLTDDYPEYSICRDLIVLKTADLISLKPHFLWIFLHSKIGQQCLLRTASQTGQPHLTVEAIYELAVPLLSDYFQKVFERLYNRVQYLHELSLISYQKAEQTLLCELGLLNWQPKHRLSFINNFSDTQTSERIDAEYFQPMYDEIIETVKKYRYGYDSVSNLFIQNRRGFTNKSEKLYQYIEISSVNTSSGEMDALSLTGKELPANAKIKLNNGDLIISKVRTYRGAVAIVRDDGLIGSGAFTVLQESGKVNKETAFVYLKSAPILKLTLKYNAGTSYPVIDDKDILNLPFPLIPEKIQQNIKQKITEMYEAKALSTRLLDIAKHGVELAIEKDEAIAEKWINAEVKKLGVEITV